MPESVRIFIGYDSNETIAYHVLVQSIIENSSLPLSITPIALNNVRSIFKRDKHPLQSTEFSFSRFLAPYLSNYEGWSIFMDCDMIVRKDIAELWNMRDDDYAVMCCKHDYTPVSDTKFLNNVQSKYEKKNWSSVMMFNNARCRALTPEYVNTRSGLELHQFKWLGNDNLIGSLPLVWNHLVEDYPYNPEAALVHYTYGGPYFEEYLDCDYAEDWQQYKRSTLHVTQRAKAEPEPA
ncbi:Glycosyl transferase family 8 [Pseudovibrio ascidiaceicola]|uniref:Glycosyl transferase family 8 n=1 Tax=Pseudovibrio ascidiaceicola TaxID=285279 RepID=A0A1I3ZLU9_9HYPH|nr:glycosyltransferase [Pseudovibrio ascidiaceicola]SFK45054.1 Glycosyl transferase family 8 [Pseudovibrio ascidiaceicola]